MSAVVRYTGTGEWSAVYLDGELQAVGDHYVVDDWIEGHFGIESESSDDFMRGGEDREDVAQTLSAIERHRSVREHNEAEAQRLRDEAKILLRQANLLDGGVS